MRNLFGMLLLLSMAASLFPSPVHAVGLAPSKIYVDSLLRNTTQMRTVTLYRSPDDIGNVHIRVEPDEFQTDFFVLEERELVILEGQNEIDYSFGVTPGSAANGEHELKLRFMKTSDPTQASVGSAVSVVTGVTAQIIATVGGEEDLEYSFMSVYGQSTEEEMDVPIVYLVNNTGNVDWRPTSIEFVIFNEVGEEAGKHIFEAGGIEPISAGQTNQSFRSYLPISLERGAYNVSVSFYNGEELAGTLESTQPFQVYPSGTLAQSGTLHGASTNKDVYTLGEKVKISAPFTNDGAVHLSAVFVTEISRDGNILDLIRSSDYSVVPEEEMVFTELLDATEIGEYSITSYVEYGNKQTPVAVATFSVVEQLPEAVDASGGADHLNTFAGLLLFTIIIFIFFLLYFLYKHKKKKKENDDPSTGNGGGTPEPTSPSVAAEALRPVSLQPVTPPPSNNQKIQKQSEYPLEESVGTWPQKMSAQSQDQHQQVGTPSMQQPSPQPWSGAPIPPQQGVQMQQSLESQDVSESGPTEESLD
ncbi:MAG: hypothetical protein P8J32_07660 [bacterium]|nr:hypothetical protein [bacterium]